MLDFIDEVRNNPVVLALLAVVLAALIYVIHKRVAAPTSTAVVSPLVRDTGVPITYNNTYNTYPVVQTKTVPDNDPTASRCKPGFHFEPTKVGVMMTKDSYAISGGYCVPNTPAVTPTPDPVGPPVHVPPTGPPVPIIPTPVDTGAKYVTVEPWPAKLSTIWGIAQSVGKSTTYIESLNKLPNPNLIYPGQKIRVA